MRAAPAGRSLLPAAGAGLLAAATAAAYAGIFSAPFVFDDLPAIVANPTIRRWSTALFPPLNTTASGRPLVNLSLALNYRVGGTAVAGYHLVNLLIHVLAGLACFGVVRQTARRCGLARTEAIAFCAALLWLLHPLQTEAVTYTVQRAESLMALCYLLSLYWLIRSRETLSVVCCALGMAAKEVMVSAPIILLLYDRTFLSGSFREAWRRRRGYYVALAATWLLPLWLVLSSHGRNGDVGFGSGVPWIRYALTQGPAIARYLHLIIWPDPLVFDYGTQWVSRPIAAIPALLLVVALAAGAAWAAGRRASLPRRIGFAGLWFFAVLAPTSLVPGIRQTAAEHRLYLALVPALALATAGIFRAAGRAALPLCLGLAALFGGLTWRRNQDYGSVLRLWSDTAAKNPSNPHAQLNLGNALAATPGGRAEAARRFEEALRLDPTLAEAHNNLGNLWATVPGRDGDAIGEYEAALRLNPTVPEAHNNLANVLNRAGRFDEAAYHYREALRLDPDYAEAHMNLALTLLQRSGPSPEAIAQLEAALRLDPGLAAARAVLASLRR